MTDVSFLPGYADVLEQVVRDAHADDGVDLECGPEVDLHVVAAQVERFAAGMGQRVRAVARSGRVEVRVARRSGRVA
jgi:hypothetical protein